MDGSRDVEETLLMISLPKEVLNKEIAGILIRIEEEQHNFRIGIRIDPTMREHFKEPFGPKVLTPKM